MKKSIIGAVLGLCFCVENAEARDNSPVTISVPRTINTIQILSPASERLMVTADENRVCYYMSNQNVDTKAVLAELLSAKSAGFKVQFYEFGGNTYLAAWGDYMLNVIKNPILIPFKPTSNDNPNCKEAAGVIVN